MKSFCSLARSFLFISILSTHQEQRSPRRTKPFRKQIVFSRYYTKGLKPTTIIAKMDRVTPRPYCNDPNDDSPTKCSLVAYYYKNTISERAWAQQVRDWESKPWKYSMLPFPEYIAHLADREIVDHARGIRYHLCEQNADIDGNPYPCEYGSEKCYHADPRNSSSVREIEAPPSRRGQRQIEAPPQRSESSRGDYSSRDSSSSRGNNGSSRGNGSSRSGYTKRMNEMSPSKKAQIDELLGNSSRGTTSARSVSSSGDVTIKMNDPSRGDSSRRNDSRRADSNRGTDSSRADSSRGNNSSRSGYSQRMSEIDPSKKALIDELLGKSARGNDSARSDRSSSSSKSNARPSERSNQTARQSPLRNEVVVRAAGISESKRASTTSKAAAGLSKLKQITYAGEDESLKRSKQSVTSSDGRSLKMLGYDDVDELKDQ